MSPILLTGDSHLGALKHAQDFQDDPRIGELEFLPLGQGYGSLINFFEVDKAAQTVAITHEEWEKHSFSQQSLNKDGDFKLLVVSMPINSSRILRDCSWHRHVPWSMKKGAKEAPLSDALVQSIIQHDCAKSIEFMTALASVGIKVAVIEGPRFFDHARYLQRKRIDVCLEIERRYRSFARDKLNAVGIDVIAQPPETISQVGTTHPDFRHLNPKDRHHANAEYGRLACLAVLEYADQYC